MNNIVPFRCRGQVGRLLVAGFVAFVTGFAFPVWADPPKPLELPDSVAAAEAEMKPYTDIITGPNIKFDMVPIPGGTFRMGSPDSEPGRRDDEGPGHEVKIAPFWMGKCEVTWDEYEVFMFTLDIMRRRFARQPGTEQDKVADLITRPTKPYTDMTFGMGKAKFPAICMTQYAAKMYCHWLSAKTGRYYRLPTEAEWEYAARAGADTAYFFGDDPAKLDEYAWYIGNSEDKYHQVGQKKASPWGLLDIHGNVAEYVVDMYRPDAYAERVGKVSENPLVLADQVESRGVRGGAWDDDAERLRCAARRGSEADWKQQDPQIPQSIWYYTDALFAGFRVVRPLVEPSEEEKAHYGPDKHQIWDRPGK